MLLAVLGVVMAPAIPGAAASSQSEIVAKCESLFGSAFGAPTGEPLADCQWDMAVINAGDESYAHATGAGVKVGVTLSSWSSARALAK